MNKVVEVNNLSFKYGGDVNILDNVSFSIEKGEYVTLVGHNGSGKSTLAKLLCGLLEKNSGEIRLFGTNLDSKTIDDLRNKVAIVFQNPDNQFIGATVREDIAFGLENRNIPRSKMDEIIDKVSKEVGMYDYLDKEPSQLSGGQKQRVAIAGVLALNPELIILDEATAMLDPKGKNAILKLISIAKEHNKDLTIISITHDIEEAYLSDRVIVLEKGKIALSGNPKEIFNNNKEKIKELSLELPFFVELKNKLTNNGFDLKDIDDEESLVRYLCHLK